MGARACFGWLQLQGVRPPSLALAQPLLSNCTSTLSHACCMHLELQACPRQAQRRGHGSSNGQPAPPQQWHPTPGKQPQQVLRQAAVAGAAAPLHSPCLRSAQGALRQVLLGTRQPPLLPPLQHQRLEQGQDHQKLAGRQHRQGLLGACPGAAQSSRAGVQHRPEQQRRTRRARSLTARSSPARSGRVPPRSMSMSG